jgi:hypothetical protein
MITKQGQCFFDLVIQGTGNVDNAFEMAVLNGLSITDGLEIGQEIMPTEVTNRNIVALFNAKHIPATSQAFPSTGDLTPESGGIGYMVIEDTFIVT